MKKKQTSIKLGLYGSSGKMGQAVSDLLKPGTKTSFTPYLAVGKVPSCVFAMTTSSLENIESEILQDVDVWIDFSSAQGLKDLLQKTSQFKTAIVSGSTGIAEKDFSALKKQSKVRPLFWASNLSLGLWVFRQALRSFTHIKNFDFAINEIHHNQKKDNPSGTAKTLQKDLEYIIGKKIKTPDSLRVGGVFGVHNVFAASSSEVIAFQHQALNRSVFAEGALAAAEWLTSKKSGLYSMDDIYLNKMKKGK